MDFLTATVEDLVCNESFQLYCLEDPSADVAFWETLISGHPEMTPVIEDARQLVITLSARQGDRLKQLQHLKDGIERFDLLQQVIGEAEVRPASPMKLYWLAAVVALGVIITTIIFFNNHTTSTLTSSLKAPEKTISSGTAPRKSMVLPDGTTVVLRSNSALTLSPGFNTTDRQIALTGEAFFDVSSNATLPFKVHTSAMDVQVLGTIFNISAYPDSRAAEASLFKGKIAVQLADSKQGPIILKPNQKLSANFNTPYTISPLKADPVSHKATEIAWVRNRLEIENEPLETIASRLGKYYGVPIRFADEEVKQYRYSGTFESESVWKALDALQLSYPFTFKMVDSTIIISK
jgi:ferric-dicitrate binding protein FerR (iron transport regulator)